MDSKTRNVLAIVASAVLLLFLISTCNKGCSRRAKLRAQAAKVQRQNQLQEPQNTVPAKVETQRPVEATEHKTARVFYTKQNGVMVVPISINENPMDLIFDTGAGLISLSNVEANYLAKRGSLTEDDVLGKANFTDANGNVNVGIIVNLKSVTVGERTIYNIPASVVNNQRAPLLFGQSAMEQFGKYTIDTRKQEIIFEYEE